MALRIETVAGCKGLSAYLKNTEGVVTKTQNQRWMNPSHAPGLAAFGQGVAEAVLLAPQPPARPPSQVVG